MELDTYVTFLKTLKKDSSLFRIKNVEMDLRGDFNPTNLLHQLFFEDENWLGFEDFYNHYVEKHEDALLRRYKPQDKDAFLLGLKARLYRTQFGFLTEYHAYLVAQDVFGTDNVDRSIELDKKGVDFQISYNEKMYNIHIFVDTPRSWYYRGIKSRTKHVDDKEGIHVNLPYALSRDKFNSLEYLANGFGIYKKGYLEFLKKEMNEGKLKTIVGTQRDGFTYVKSL